MQKVLTSWKSIALYVDRGVRTVQRWEQEFEFPVRRPIGKGHRAVLAVPEEIDAWILSQGPAKRSELENLRAEVARLRAEAEKLRAEVERLQAELREGRQNSSPYAVGSRSSLHNLQPTPHQS